MKQCPRCNRNYADDGLSFCLEDGSVLVKKYDADATMINPYPPALFVPPTVASQRAADTIPVQPQVPTRVPSQPEPAPPRRSPWVVGGLVLVALAVGLTIGGFIFQRSNATSSTSASLEPNRNPVATQTTTPTSVTSSPSPSPVPTEVPSPSSSIEQSSTVQEPDCMLYNDKSDKNVVNVRRDCDTRNCELDASTKSGEYPDNTPIRVIKGSNVYTTNFTWVKVIITGSGTPVWVASTKIKCR